MSSIQWASRNKLLVAWEPEPRSHAEFYRGNMKSFKQFTETTKTTIEDLQGLGTYILSEELHSDIQSAMDSETDPKQKLNAVTKVARGLIAKGQDTGLESDKPKKGSSRAVFFPKQPKKINLDGHDVETPSAVKIAFAGSLDKYNKSGRLLGQHQNEVESDHWINRAYGIASPDHEGKWHTNEEGILPPHFGHHEDHHHLEMGRVEKITSKGFKDATKHPDFPKGITHKEFYDTVVHNWAQAHGQRHYCGTSEERMEQLQDHPLISKVTDFVGNTDNHPADMNTGNMGLWHHPVTGKKHVVLSDFGFSKNVAREYNEARKEKSRRVRGW